MQISNNHLDGRFPTWVAGLPHLSAIRATNNTFTLDMSTPQRALGLKWAPLTPDAGGEEADDEGGEAAADDDESAEDDDDEEEPKKPFWPSEESYGKSW